MDENKTLGKSTRNLETTTKYKIGEEKTYQQMKVLSELKEEHKETCVRQNF